MSLLELVSVRPRIAAVPAEEADNTGRERGEMVQTIRSYFSYFGATSTGGAVEHPKGKRLEIEHHRLPGRRPDRRDIRESRFRRHQEIQPAEAVALPLARRRVSDVGDVDLHNRRGIGLSPRFLREHPRHQPRPPRTNRPRMGELPRGSDRQRRPGSQRRAGRSSDRRLRLLRRSYVQYSGGVGLINGVFRLA